MEQLNLFNYKNDDYAVGFMFSQYRHHDPKTGKPTDKLLTLSGEWLQVDAHLFFILRDGLVIVEYTKGIITGFCHLQLKKNELKEIEHKPFGTLKQAKNKVEIPKNILNEALKYMSAYPMDQGWINFKMLINNKNLLDTNNYIFGVLTTKQDRVPNIGMVIKYPENDKNNGKSEAKKL